MSTEITAGTLKIKSIFCNYYLYFFRHNILWLSQSKFASHVVEQALVYADSQSLYAMFSEILDGYETDAYNFFIFD